jgi:hypothetical protein
MEWIMKTRYLASALLMAGLTGLGNPAAMASDELAGALIGAGAGAAIGHAMNGHDGAIIGGFLGAMVGASVADDDHHTLIVRHRPRYIHAPPPARYYGPPPYWSRDRDYRHDGYWDRDRRDGRDRDRDGRHDRRGGHFDDPWDNRW